MSLIPGDRLGPYEVLAKLGEGGMGEVYRARDSKLDRDVALKILPESLASDTDRCARFEREAKTLALLNHPNIAHVYDAGTSQSVAYLVMELVEGDDLSAHISRGALSLAEALPIAKQVADALEAAHELGIVHRDLKPANIKVRPDGTVKILDFGLAKALDVTASSAASEAMNSPTLTARATQMGMIVGTAAYMAPEQAKGKPVDKRADVWAFGVVLFEMLTGRRLFEGDSVVETMGFVATKNPDWTTLPASTPAAIRRLLARCLTRDPKHRLRDIGEARISLAQTEDVAEVAPTTGRHLWIIAAFSTVAALVLGWYLGSGWRTPPVATAAPFHSEIVPTPADAFGRHLSARIFTFTPDGRTLIYASTDPAGRKLYRRDQDSDVAVPITGTEGAYGPFMSPTGASIGFFADGQMKRVPLGGGTIQTIRDFRDLSAPDRIGVGWNADLGCSQTIAYGADWLEDDTIVYGRFTGGLWRVGADGGTPTQLTTVTGDGELAHRVPHALPGGAVVLFTAVRDLINREGSTVEAINAATGVRTKLLDDATDGRFARGGYLLFARSGGLYSVRFDPAKLEISGEPVKVSGNLMHAVGGGSPARASGVAQYDISEGGVLAMLQGGMLGSPQRELIWVYKGGRTERLEGPAGGYLGPRLSLDGSRIATRFAPDVVSIGVKDGIATPIVKSAMFPVWHPDGSRVFVGLRQPTLQNIYSVLLAGGTQSAVAQSANVLWPSSVSRDGKTLFYVESNPKTGNDIWSVGLSANSAPAVILATAANESYPMLSPDGQWLAYVVGDCTSSEIEVRAFPGPGVVERISRDGGIAPVWSDDGRAIFYGRLPAGALTMRDIVRVPINTTGGRISLGEPAVFAAAPLNFTSPVGSFDVAKDESRILASRNVEPAPGAPTINSAGTTIRLIVNPNLAGRRER